MQVVRNIPLEIAELDPHGLDRLVGKLGALIGACVSAGASIGFVLPFERVQAEAFWSVTIAPELKNNSLRLLVAMVDGQPVGTGLLAHSMPANQPHRAEIRKVMVHPDWRRRGIARLLIAGLEDRAKAMGKTLLTLDTRTGDAAEPLYASMGYQTTGIIPGYCIDAITGALDGTTIMYKNI